MTAKMSDQQAPYVTLDVFTDERYKGNQVAIVDITTSSPPSSQSLQAMAREFNFSETVFLHRPAAADQPPSIRIFTPVNEMQFAGHPVIGTGHVLFRNLLASRGTEPPPQGETLTIQAKAGPIVVRYDRASGLVSAEVPHDVHVHSVLEPKQAIFQTQPLLAEHALAAPAAAAAVEDAFPVVSVVRGVTYVLVDLTRRPDLFAAIRAGPCPMPELDEDWRPSFSGTMYYLREGEPCRGADGVKEFGLRVRMAAIGLEDPACGSGACALAAYLALREGEGGAAYRFRVSQGREIGRDSRMVVDVTLDAAGEGIASMTLSGGAVPVMRGELVLPAE